MNAPIKPIAVAAAEAKHTIIKCINDLIQENNLPFFVLEPIMKDLYEEVRANMIQEQNTATEQYNRAMSDYQASIAPAEEVVGEVID